MAYRDPTLLRQHVVKLRFSDEEDRLLEALADLTGEQKAVMVRRFVMDRVMALRRAQCSREAQGVEVVTWDAVCA